MILVGEILTFSKKLARKNSTVQKNSRIKRPKLNEPVVIVAKKISKLIVFSAFLLQMSQNWPYLHKDPEKRLYVLFEQITNKTQLFSNIWVKKFKTPPPVYWKQVKPGFTNYQSHPKYFWALIKLKGKGN